MIEEVFISRVKFLVEFSGMTYDVCFYIFVVKVDYIKYMLMGVFV